MDLTTLLAVSPVIIAVWVGILVFSAIANGMPAPTEQHGTAYRWTYNTLHALGANAKELLALVRPKPTEAPKQ